MPLGMEVGLVPGNFVLEGEPAPQKKGTAPTQFSAHVYIHSSVKDACKQHCPPRCRYMCTGAELTTFGVLLWPPCVADADIIVSSRFFLLLSSFFPRLISVVAGWMSTVLPHMVWP